MDPLEPWLLATLDTEEALSRFTPFVLELELVFLSGPFFLSLSLLASGLGRGSECIRAMDISWQGKSL